MIRLCTCSGGSASTLELSRSRVAVASCKICGGKPLVDGRGSLSGSMLSTVGLELTTVFNPDLSWKTVSKGNRSASRRARRPVVRSVEGSAKPVAVSAEGGDKEDSKKLEDMPVSESEKLGVTVLGRRFSDKIEHVPIKKRRFLFRSPSPPPRIPSPRQHDSGWIFNSQPASGRKETSPNSTKKERVVGISSAVANELGQGVSVDGKNSKEVHLKLDGHEDFSGISILAAAACNNNIEGGSSNDEEGTTDEKSSVREGSFDVLVKSKSRAKESCIDEPQKCAKISNGGADLCVSAVAMEDTSSSPETSEDDTKNKATMARDVVDGKNVGSPVSLSDSTAVSTNLPSHKDDEALRKLESASRDDRLHWDLNVVMDAWENPCEDTIVGSQTNVVQGAVSDDSGQSENGQRGTGGSDCAIEKTVGPLVEEAKDTNGHEDSGTAVAGFQETNREVHTLDACIAVDQVSSFQGKVPSLEIDNAKVDLVKETKLACDQETLDSNAVDNDACVGQFSSAGAESITCNPLPEETRNEASQIDICKQTESVCDADLEVGEIITSRNSQSDKCDTALADSVTSKRASNDENADRNSNFLIVGHAPKIEMSLEPVPLNDDVGMSDGSGVTQAPPNCEDVVDNAKDEENILINEVALVHGEFEKSTLKLSGGTPDVVETQTALGSLSSDEACRSYDDPVNSIGKVDLEDPFNDSDYDSDVSHDEPEDVPEIKKEIELQEAGYDSQYEDGELRESTEHNWEDPGEEVEAEHVDYGSDNRESYGFEAPEDYQVSMSLHVAKGADCQKERYTEVDKVEFGGDQFKEKTNCKPFIKGLLNRSVMEHGSGKEKTIKDVNQQLRGRYGPTGDIAKLKMDANVDGVSIATADMMIQEDDSCGSRNAAKESSQLARMKLSGWDKLPEGCQSSAVTMDAWEGSGKKNYAGPHVDVIDSKGSGAGVVGSVASGAELPSFIEGTTSSDMLLRKDRASILMNRSNNFDDSNPRVEMDTGSGKSIGRGGSMHMHGRGRGSDCWVDSSRGSWGQNHHGSPSYYGPANFVHPAAKNAAAAAAAKVHSNGFIVAPDGTIIKPGMGPSPSARVQRQPVNVPSQVGQRSITRRGSPTDRDETFGMHMGLGPVGEISPDRSNSLGRSRSGRYGPRVVRTGPRERYNGSLPDDSIDASFRRQSFSPIHRKGAPHLSQQCTRSRSRSRTRSPNMWSSPRGRCSRSPPNFRSETRMDRRSPHRRPGFGPDHIVGFASIPRRRGSPQHPPRWIDNRKDGMDHFREHGYNKRSSASGRGSPGRNFRRRIDLVDSSERLRPDDYYNRPMHPGRFPQVVGTGRRPSRYDGSDDDKRKPGDRYGMVHPFRRYDADEPVKRFQYDVEGGFAVRDSRNKDFSGFHSRGNPKEDYIRGIDSRLGDAPPRGSREEKGHFRYGRDGKYEGNSKSFGARDCEDDIAPKRRRP